MKQAKSVERLIGRITAAHRHRFADILGGAGFQRRLSSSLRTFVRERGYRITPETLDEFADTVFANELRYQEKKQVLLRRAQRIMQNYISGRLTKRQTRTALRLTLEQGHKQAMLAGKAQALGRTTRGLRLTDEDITELAETVHSEWSYLEGVLDELSALKRVRADLVSARLKWRIGLYIRAFDATKSATEFRYRKRKPGVQVWWRLGPTEQHCKDCIRLARKSPWRPEKLPTTPGAGDTACLRNCACFLEFTRVTKKSEVRAA